MGIVGLGGFGKSTLAAKVYQESAVACKFWADISAGTEFSELARQALVAWGLEAEQVAGIPDQGLIEIWIQQMQQTAGLLVIDNLETMLTASGAWQSPIYQQFLQSWIEYGTKTKLVLTSRERPPLAALRTQWCGLEGLDVTEGAALLWQLGVLGAAAELEAVSQQVGGYPLSLVLMAGWLQAEEPHDPQVRYLQQSDLFQSNLFQIEGLHRGQSQISIEQIFDWSFNRLSPSLQQLLTQISVYRGAFNLTAATALMPEIEMTETGITESDLRQLVGRSLLQELKGRDRTNQRQFRLQPQVQTLVQQKISEKTSDWTVAHERAIAYYQSVVQPAPWQELPDVAEYLEIFYHHCQLQQYAAAFKTLWYSGCNSFLDLRGYNAFRVELYQPLVTQWQPSDAEQAGFGAMLNLLGNAYYSLGQYQKAIEYHQRTLTIAQQISDQSGEAASLGNLGNVYYSLGRYQKAIEYYQQSLTIARQIGDRRGEAASLGNLGNAYYSLGQYLEAIEYHQQHLSIAQQIGDRRGEANALANLGDVLEKLGEFAAAEANYQQAKNLYAAMGVEEWQQWCEQRLQKLKNSHSRSLIRRCVSWFWRMYQTLWLKLRRFFER